MSIRSRIQDGAGTTIKPEVFDHKLRELEVQQSATNHISTAQLGGQTGVFSLKFASTIAQETISNNAGNTLLSIANNDPLNLLVIDIAYIQITSSSITLPDPNFIIVINNVNGANPPTFTNDNRFSTITPIVTPFRNTGNLSTIAAKNVLRIFPTLGDINEFIITGSDGIILPGRSTKATGATDRNIFAIAVFNNTGIDVTITFNALIKFMMVPPSSLG